MLTHALFATNTAEGPRDIAHLARCLSQAGCTAAAWLVEAAIEELAVSGELIYTEAEQDTAIEEAHEEGKAEGVAETLADIPADVKAAYDKGFTEGRAEKLAERRRNLDRICAQFDSLIAVKRAVKRKEFANLVFHLRNIVGSL